MLDLKDGYNENIEIAWMKERRTENIDQIRHQKRSHISFPWMVKFKKQMGQALPIDNFITVTITGDDSCIYSKSDETEEGESLAQTKTTI